jgi:hypothetical protein
LPMAAKSYLKINVYKQGAKDKRVSDRYPHRSMTASERYI